MSLTKDDLKAIQEIIEPIVEPIYNRLETFEKGQAEIKINVGTLEAKQDAFEAKQDAFEAKQDAFEAKQDAFEAKQDAFEARQDAFEAKQDAFEAKQDAFEERLDHFEERLDRVEEILQTVHESQVRVELEWLPKIGLALDAISASIEKNTEQDKRISVLENTTQNHSNRIFALEQISKAN